MAKADFDDRRIDADPEFTKAKAILRGLVAKSPNPHLPEERLRVNEELLELIDVPHLSALALAHWFNDTYDDVLEERPAPKIKRASAKHASRSAKKKRAKPRSGKAAAARRPRAGRGP